jgi:DNA-binding transcriptional ArsR family regulator
MSKVTLDMNTFKALASDTRLDILKSLDGKKMSLNDICKATNLNKATLHEHLAKLHEAGLVKRNEREGHKWVYYKLSWMGECLLHPENTRIVVMFTTTFLVLTVGIIQIVSFIKGRLVSVFDTHIPYFQNYLNSMENRVSDALTKSEVPGSGSSGTFGGPLPSTLVIFHDPTIQYFAIVCIVIFSILLSFSIWRLRKNRTPKL